LKLWARTRKTILFVTHSINEAVILSDRIAILEEGHILREFAIEIPRPRSFDTFHTKQFAEIAREIRAVLPAQPNLPRRVPA
jgi:NitT/TauT family transport system ATP-binding protein